MTHGIYPVSHDSLSFLFLIFVVVPIEIICFLHCLFLLLFYDYLLTIHNIQTLRRLSYVAVACQAVSASASASPVPTVCRPSRMPTRSTSSTRARLWSVASTKNSSRRTATTNVCTTCSSCRLLFYAIAEMAG